MIVIVPIGGVGKRFKSNGYKKPKALISLYGKPIISYLLDNLNTQTVDYIFIPYNKEYKKYRFESLLKKQYPHIPFKFLCLEHNTKGAAETIDTGIANLDEKRDVPVICIDSDTFYTTDILSQWNGENCVFSFEDLNDNPIFSYVTTSESGEVTNIREKNKISNYACTGAYGFKSIVELKAYTSKIIGENITQKKEFYTSGVIKEMINAGHVFRNKVILHSNFICLGTPLQLKFFCNNFPRISALSNDIRIKTRRICFDLDNTLVTFPTVANDYTSVKPIKSTINYLKYLKSFGNTIIIYTARRMRTHSGNVGKINADIGKLTFETLEKFDIPYDEIYFGKPHADFYIDDLAVSCFADLEKELGYYNAKIHPRDFHTISVGNINTVIKKGDLEGENFYYENIPTPLKDLFPIYLSGNSKCITIERIFGPTATDLYVSEVLSDSTLAHILNSIHRIQNFAIDDNENIDIYENYAKKLMCRYDDFDYSPFVNSETMYEDLLVRLRAYEQQKAGRKTMIHGDPVFTNIILNQYGKIKFIDMRGKMGGHPTIFGDWLYDWAKVFQSLIGYDEILLSKAVSIQYKESMIATFKTYFIKQYCEEDFNNLKMITKSLIFTLIPLHNNDKCKKYYHLLSSKYLL